MRCRAASTVALSLCPTARVAEGLASPLSLGLDQCAPRDARRVTRNVYGDIGQAMQLSGLSGSEVHAPPRLALLRSHRAYSRSGSLSTLAATCDVLKRSSSVSDAAAHRSARPADFASFLRSSGVDHHARWDVQCDTEQLHWCQRPWSRHDPPCIVRGACALAWARAACTCAAEQLR